MTIRIYTAKHCVPCHDVEDFLKKQNNHIDGEDVKLIDVESDDGFKEFKEEILSKGDAAVPSAYKNGEKCLLKIEDEVLHLICGENDQPLHLTQLSGQPEEPESDTS